MSLKSIFSTLSWFTQFPLAYTTRDEITKGGIVTDGTATATTMMCNVSEMECILNGKIKNTISAIVDDDLLDDATAGVEQPIFMDGADASGLSLGADEVANVALIVCNSKGDGTVDDLDGGAAVLVAVVGGDAATYNGAAIPSSNDITAALAAATGVHDGDVSWQWVAQLSYADTGGAAWAVTPTNNRNNVLGV
jgi:hypothetical protein